MNIFPTAHAVKEEEGKKERDHRVQERFIYAIRKKVLSRRGRLHSAKAIHIYVHTENVKKPPIVNANAAL